MCFKKRHTAHFRIWLLAKSDPALNPANWIAYDLLKEATADLFGQRTLKNRLNEGDNIFWSWDKTNGRVYLKSPKFLAVALGVPRLENSPVYIPVEYLTSDLTDFNAVLYAAWHEGRDKTPISRDTIKALTGISISAQKLYEKHPCIKTAVNIQILDDTDDPSTLYFRYGYRIFRFKGNMVKRLPNSYITTLCKAPRGNQKKWNKSISLACSGYGSSMLKRHYIYCQTPTDQSELVYVKTTLFPNVWKHTKFVACGVWV